MDDLLYTDSNLYVKYIDDIKGWGVFAKDKIEMGKVIERINSIPVNIAMKDFYDYFFDFNGTDTLVPLGYGCIYNHNEQPNINWKVVDTKRFIIEFYTLREIEIDEELCHNYGGNYWTNKNKKII
jgi:SET domain-containing protein